MSKSKDDDVLHIVSGVNHCIETISCRKREVNGDTIMAGNGVIAVQCRLTKHIYLKGRQAAVETVKTNKEAIRIITNHCRK